MELASNNIINRFFSQLGVSFVQDRSACCLSASGIAVSQPRGSDSRSGRNGHKRRHCRESATVLPDVTDACAVCQDLASGGHYGAATCDSCKEFFEQSVRGRRIYDCHFSRACDLRLQRRNHCQGCRWDRCIEAGMVTSAVKRIRERRNRSATDTQTHLVHPWSRPEEADGMLGAPLDTAFDLATPRPSLPSPTTDAESGSQCSSGTDESERRLALDLILGDDGSGCGCGQRLEMPPISAELMRAALTPIPMSQRNLGAQLLELERSCLVNLFGWNKRRLAGECGATVGGSFGAAAANLTPILLATAVRSYLAGWRSPDASPAAELTDRLKWLLRGKEAEFEPLMSDMDCLIAHIGDLCGRLIDTILELKQDALSDLILLLAEDRTDEEVPARQASDRRTLRAAACSLAATADRLKSAGPERLALLLAALVSDPESPPEDANADSSLRAAVVATTSGMASGREADALLCGEAVTMRGAALFGL